MFYGVFEQRSEINQDWLSVFGSENTYEVFSRNDLVSVRIPKFKTDWISLRNRNDLLDFVERLNASSIYLDITGLPHHVWMPLARVFIDAGTNTSCIYVEPKSYTDSPTPKPGEFFDLSERIQGFFPIPTFVSLMPSSNEDTILIPLLGFEGVRFRHLIEKFEPNERNIAPIIGVPGFELNYPFHTFEGNASVLSITRSWQRVNFVDAACPFSLYSCLSSVQERDKNRLLQIATIGTKPHALGAMMFAMKNDNVALLHDHPIRRKERTKGMAKCHLYHVSAFMNKI